MKNLIIALSLLFAVSASAQAKKAAPAKAVKTEVVKAKLSNEEAARKNVQDLNAYAPINEVQQTNLQMLFTTKYKWLNENGELSAERKAYIADIIGKKLEATLQGPTYEKVKANTALYNSLVN